MSSRKPIRVPARYEEFLTVLQRDPYVKLKSPMVVKELSPTLAPIGTFYRNPRLHESVFIRSSPFAITRKTPNYVFLELF
jgi:hypothetical protein